MRTNTHPYVQFSWNFSKGTPLGQSDLRLKMHRLVGFRPPRLFSLSKFPLKPPEVWVPAPSSPLRHKRSLRLPAGDPASVLCTEACTQPTRVEAPASTHAGLLSVPSLLFLFKDLQFKCNPGQEQLGARRRTSPRARGRICAGASAYAHTRESRSRERPPLAALVATLVAFGKASGEAHEGFH